LLLDELLAIRDDKGTCLSAAKQIVGILSYQNGQIMVDLVPRPSFRDVGQHSASTEATAVERDVMPEFCRNTSKLFDSLVGCLMTTANMSADY
jgi:hypothetical protein